MLQISHTIMKHMKNRWLFENGQINSNCESCLKYSNINLDESKVLTNSMGAILYISKEWDISRKKNNNNYQKLK